MINTEEIRAKIDSLEVTIERAKQLALSMSALTVVGYVTDAKNLFYASAAFGITECLHVNYCNHRLVSLRQKLIDLVEGEK